MTGGNLRASYFAFFLLGGVVEHEVVAVLVLFGGLFAGLWA